MKEQLEKELLNSLETVKDYLSKTAEFASEQAPIVVEELIRFNLWYSGALIIVAFPLFLFALKLWRLGIEAEKKADAICFWYWLSASFTSMGASVLIVSKLKTFIMCLTAPRLFVIEYLQGML